jgi:hypothetical protein
MYVRIGQQRTLQGPRSGGAADRGTYARGLRSLNISSGSALGLGSPPRRHWRLFSDNHPRPPTALAQERVELSAAHGDGATVGEGSIPAARLDGGHKGAFGCQVRFNE